MSDQEHDFGDLFGSENEESDLEETPSRATSPETRDRVESDVESQTNHNDQVLGKRPARSQNHDDGIEQEVDRFFDEEDEEDNEQEDEDEGDRFQEKKQRIAIDIEMPSLPLPVSSDGKFFLAKLPRFLDVDPNAFEPESTREAYEQEMQESSQPELLLQQMERTVRWRQGVDPNGEEVMETNTHFIEWEDGTTSLMVGKELYDVIKKPIHEEEHLLLLAHQTNSGVLESHAELTHQMTFRPSETYRPLTSAAAEKTKQAKTKMFFTEQDPEQMKQNIEAQENERLKAQRKLENQRRRMDTQYATSSSSYLYNDYDDEDDEGEDYEEGDYGAEDYDSAEEEEREARLNRLKGR
ncbi:hypothetical protein K492DRAFT_211292 [Lichtheimia hyalospora FSU 10163]|nr:hypothetical protein K492DRAFT_211292 [Lichtheimia hyalospora FSU 10163]